MLSSIKRACICYSLCILFSYWWEQRERKKARRFSVAVAIYVRLLRLLRQWRNPSHSSQPKRLRLGNTLWLWTSNDSTFSSWCVRSIVLLGKLEWKTSRSQRREFFFVVVKSWISVFFFFFSFLLSFRRFFFCLNFCESDLPSCCFWSNQKMSLYTPYLARIEL